MKKRKGICLVLLFVLTTAAMHNAKSIWQMPDSISLRWQQPITIQDSARTCGNMTFWREENGVASGMLRTAQATVIYYEGDSALATGMPCIEGVFPAGRQQNVCVLSTELSQQLFGSASTVGLTIQSETDSYKIVGVIPEKKPVMLCPDTDGPFTAVEVPNTENLKNDPEGELAKLLRQAELPPPDWILYRRDLSVLMSLMAWSPVLFCGLVLIGNGFAACKKFYPWQREWLLFACLLLLAIGLPWIFSALPQWIVPPRWSDFSWWYNLFLQLQRRAMDWLSAISSGWDVTCKVSVLKQGGLLVLQIIVCETLRCTKKSSITEGARLK